MRKGGVYQVKEIGEVERVEPAPAEPEKDAAAPEAAKEPPPDKGGRGKRKEK